MLAKTIDLVRDAQHKGIAVGAFNTYNMEMTQALIAAAEQLNQPIILQLGVPSLKANGEILSATMLAAARVAHVPVALHLDHCSDEHLIEQCFDYGFSSALADGSRLSFAENMAFVRCSVEIAAHYAGAIEAELGYLSGSEDGITVEEVEASLTDPAQAHKFISETGAALLAVSIGNVHGYVPNPPPLDFEQLGHIRSQVSVPLVLHGASGVSKEDVQRAIHMGIAKLNINTEVRTAFLKAIAQWSLRVGPEPDTRKKGQDMLDLMQEAIAAAKEVAVNTIRTCNFL